MYVSNETAGTVSKFSPGSTTPIATLTGLSAPESVVVDSSGNIYATSYNNNKVVRYSNTLVSVPGGIAIQSSVESRPMLIGGTNTPPVAGINLTSAELAQISTTSSGTITIGDAAQTGNITFTTATPATTAGAALNVIQSTVSSAAIIFNSSSGSGLNGNGGTVTLTPGTGGLQATLYSAGTPLVTDGFATNGQTLGLSLGFAPSLGTQLTVVSNTATPAGSNPINGTFSNLAQGATVALSYLGTPHYFQANYLGGDGNDLVLTDVAGPAAQLVVTSQPSTVAAGNTFGFTVTAEDAQGNLANSFTGSVIIALAADPGSTTLGGTLTATAVAGVATFSGLSLNKVASGYTLTAAGSSLTSATSSGITVTPGTATQLLLTTQPPSTVVAGGQFGLTVTAEDSFGNVATGFAGSETVSLASSSGGGTLGGTVTISASSGIATFSGLSLNKVGSYTLGVTSGTLASASSSSISVTPGATTQLLITSQPQVTVTAGSTFGFTVTAEDAQGNVTTGFSGSETVAIASNPGGSTLSGTRTVTASGGIATFAGLSLNKADGGYTLAVTSGTLTAATSSAISVTPGAATQLLITNMSPSVTAGIGFGLTVTAEDSLGNVATGFSGSETLALASNPGNSTLGGTLTVSATSGLASFSGLTLNKVSSGYTFSVTSGSLTSATSSAVSVAPGAATQLIISGQPPATVTAGGGFGLTLVAEDAQGNVATGFTGSETVALATNSGGSTLGGTLTVLPNAGITIFSGLTLNKVAAGYTLQATGAGLPSVTTNAIQVNVGALAQLAITSEPPASVTAGSSFGLTATAEDAEGNEVSGFTGNVTVALAANPGGSTLGGTLTVAAANSVAVFSDLTLNLVDSGYTLAVGSGTLASATSSGISVAPGAATQLLITSQPPATVIAGSGFGVTVTAEDAEGNVATGFMGSVSAALAANPGSSTLAGTLTASAVAGVASFSGLTLDMPSPGYTLQLSASGLTSAVTDDIDVPPVLMINATNDSNNDVDITFTGSNQFAVDSGGSTSTTYSTTNFNQVVYNAPAGTGTKLVFDDPSGAFTANQSLGSTTISQGNFQFQANGATALYLYGGPGSSATVDVSNGGSSSSNFFVVDTDQNYSYIADPGTGAYSELSGFGSETVTGAAGTTYAYIYSTSNAKTVASPTQTTFTVGGVTSTLSNFPQVYVVGAADGTDSVTLDSSGGTFVSSPGFSYATGTASGTNFLLGAVYAANVTAQASTGGKDAAVFYSYPSNTFTGAPGRVL